MNGAFVYNKANGPSNDWQRYATKTQQRYSRTAVHWTDEIDHCKSFRCALQKLYCPEFICYHLRSLDGKGRWRERERKRERERRRECVCVSVYIRPIREDHK